MGIFHERTTRWKWYDWTMLVLRTLVFISVLYNASVVQDQFSLPFWLIDVVVGLSYIIPFLLLQRNRIFYFWGEIFFLALLTPMFAQIDASTAGNYVSYCLMLGFYQERNSRRWRTSIIVTIIVLGPILVLFESPITYISILISAFVFYGLGFMLNALLHAKEEVQKKNELIEQQNKMLTQYSKQVEQNTILQERNRISTELQYSVSHTFAALILEMETLRNQLLGAKTDPLFQQLIDRTRLGLHQVREAIKHLEPLDIDLSIVEIIKRVIDDVQKETACTFAFSVKGEEPPLPKQAIYTFTRCLQELLNCSIQVGNAQTLGVTLHFFDDYLEIWVEDDGLGSEQERLEAGLTTVHEQMTLIKGEFSVTSFLNKGITAVCKAPIVKENNEGSIKVLVMDSNLHVRESLVTLLTLQSDIEVVGQTDHKDEANRICEEKRPNIILLDVKFKDTDIIAFTQRLKRTYPLTRIMITTSKDDIDEAVELIHAGAEGYISKNTPIRELITKIQLVHMGETIISQTVAKQLILKTKSVDSEKDQLEKWKKLYSLTDRETEVLKLLADGLKYKEISEQLFLAEGTVRNYISSIYSKLEVKDRDEAMEKAFQAATF
ncbi:response regulator [Bacillus sp. CGMCC 1.16607]|uniref:response regulator n=1 Tax=Bacillus sp. CGMCC 1.16607 TaxID=3351842 RepID=UPI0036274215